MAFHNPLPLGTRLSFRPRGHPTVLLPRRWWSSVPLLVGASVILPGTLLLVSPKIVFQIGFNPVPKPVDGQGR